jgi:hypothetical protein
MKNSSNDHGTAQATADKLAEFVNNTELSFAKAKEKKLPAVTAAFEKLKAPVSVKMGDLMEQERAANKKNHDKMPGRNSLTKAIDPSKTATKGMTA